MQTLTITKPDDWHLHLREGADMASIIQFSARQMGRAIIMPNLKLPITNAKQAEKYRLNILSTLPKNSNFTPLMTLYLTDETSVKDIVEAKKNPFILAAKLYPAGSTTNSANGVSSIDNIYSVLAKMQALDMALLIHGEVVDDNVDIFDREKVFIDTILSKIYQEFPSLRIVFEHITTKDAVDFVLATNDNIAATITSHHLLANRNDMLAGGIRPHYFCLPVLKRKNPHQKSLITAAISGNKKFFLGTDSAPHTKQYKENSCGCAGVFTANAAIELYATVFDNYNSLDKLEAFSSFYGADFYKLRRNKSTITLVRKKQQIPANYTIASGKIVPFLAGNTINWSIAEVLSD